MALDLTMSVIVDAAQAKAELRAVEQGVKGIESAARGTAPAVNNVVRQLTGHTASANSAAQATARLSETTQNLAGVNTRYINTLVTAGQSLGIVDSRSGQVIKQMGGLAAATGMSAGAFAVLGGAITAVVATGILELKFLGESIALYAEKSGMLRRHEAAIDNVRGAWEDMKYAVGAILVGNQQDFTRWLQVLEGGINILAGVLLGFVAKFRAELQLAVDTLMWMANKVAAIVPGGSTIIANGISHIAGQAYRPPPSTGTYIGSSVDPFNTGGGYNPYFTPSQHEIDTMPADTWVDRQQRQEAERRRREAERMRRDAEARYAFITSGQGNPGWRMGIPGGSDFGLPYEMQAPYSPGRLPFGNLMGAMPGYNVGIPGLPNAPAPGFWGHAFGGSGVTGGTAGFLGAGMSNALLQALMSGGGAGGAISGIGSMLGGGLGGGLAHLMTSGAGMAIGGLGGGILNAILPGVGALAGPLLNKIFGGLFGKTQGRKDLEAANGQIGAQQSDLLKQFGSLENIKALGGGDLVAAWGSQNVKGLEHFTNEAKKFTATATGGMNDMIRNAALAGKEIPASMMPVLESMIRSGQLTQENANLLRGLPEAGVPSFAAIQQAAALFGVEVDALGEKVKQIGVTESAEQAAEAWNLLVLAGADMNVVAAGAVDKMQAYIDSGMTLPETLRPALQTMVDLGLLTDANGEKLKNLDGIDFAKTLTDSVDDLVLALKDLVATMRGEVTSAVDDLSSQEVIIGVRYEERGGKPRHPDDTGDGGADPVPMARGGYGTVYRPTLFLAGEAGPEQFAFSGAGRGFGRGGGITLHIHNPTIRNDRDIDELTEKIARRVMVG